MKSSNSLSKKYQYLNELDLNSLKLLLDNEIIKLDKDYDYISNLSIAIKDKESALTPKQKEEAKQKYKPVNIQGKSILKILLNKLDKSTRFKFYLICFIVSVYLGIWFYNKLVLNNDFTDFYNQNIFSRLIFGLFLLITIATYGIFYILKTNFSVSINYSGHIIKKVLFFLGISSLIDLVFLMLDIGKFEFLNYHLIFFALSSSLLIKFYAYTIFFRTKGEKNYFVENNIGYISRLFDYQFLVILFAILTQLILGIVTLLVYLYDLKNLRPENVFFGFLFPFSITFVAGALSLVYFNFSKKVNFEFSVIIKYCFPVFGYILSFITIPIAIIFFVFHASFGFTKIFEIDNFSNPTLLLSQIYISITLITLLSFLILKILRPFRITHNWDKILKYNLVFHLSYSLMGIIFAFIALTIRILNYGLTGNRIFGLFILILESIGILYAMIRLIDIKLKKVTDSIVSYNDIYKFLFVSPIIILFFSWVLFGVVRFDRVNSIQMISQNETPELYEIKNTNNYILDTIKSDLQSSIVTNDFKEIKINRYIKNMGSLGQFFLIFNLTGTSSVESYGFHTRIKEFIGKYRLQDELFLNKFGSGLDVSSAEVLRHENRVRLCRSDLNILLRSENIDLNSVRSILLTWNYLTHEDFNFNDAVSIAGFQEFYYFDNFWKSCFTLGFDGSVMR